MYKYCLVPKCTNTTVSTPNKIFFNVPNDSVLRKKWCKLMKRDDKTPLSCRSTLHCCEDHFDVESDMENYIKYKLVGGNVRLRKGILPHKFECQKQKKPVERSAYEKRRRIEYYEKLLSPEVQHENLQVQPIEHMELMLRMLAVMQDRSKAEVPKEFLETGRTGRRNAMPDILQQAGAEVTVADLPAKLQQLVTTDADAAEAGPSNAHMEEKKDENSEEGKGSS